MTVRNGREFLSIPGPTSIPDEVLAAMHRPAVDIYSGELLEITSSCLADLRRVFGTAGKTYIYAANGHGAWEAALANVLSRGERVLVACSGRFARGWGEMASALGLEVEAVASDGRSAIDPEAVESRLRKDRQGRIKAVLAVQIDTASGAASDIAALRAAIDAAGHDALLMVDTIASLAIMPFEMDAWRVDVSVAGSQKGLMMPPGLSFVAASDKAREVHRSANLCTRYWDWTAREGEVHYQKYCGTPPEHLLFGLRKSLDMLLEEGLDQVIRRHALLAEATRRAVGVWSEGQVLEFNVIDPAARSNSVTPVVLRDGRDPAPLLRYCRERCGVVLGIGIGELDGKAFRIAHMGHLNAPMILGTLGVIEVGLGALGIPHGSGGTQAAVDWLAKSVAA